MPGDITEPQATPADRLSRIAGMHHKHVDSRGGTYGDCNECGVQWPCPTYIWADTSTPRDVLDPWDPKDGREV